MSLRATRSFVLRHLPWGLLLGGGIGWGLVSFERHVRADQHARDLQLFRDWVRAHVDEVREDPTRARQ